MDTINVDEREAGLSSKELRLARQENRIPAAIYGKGVPSVSVFLRTPAGKVRELKMGKHFKIKMNGKTLQATVDEVQKDPVSKAPLHVSLHAVQSDQVMKVEVPIIMTGQAPGQKQGGIITQTKNTLSLRGKFEDLPEEVVVDVGALEVNQHIEVKDIALPKDVEVLEDSLEQTVVVCAYSNVSMEAATEEEATEETAKKPAEAAESTVEKAEEE